ncbi:hypothetical protein WJX77_000248 [Trebouxia sp. C0004]
MAMRGSPLRHQSFFAASIAADKLQLGKRPSRLYRQAKHSAYCSTILPKSYKPKHVMKWWQKVSQNFNADGIRLFAYIIGGHPELSMAHVTVPDIRWVDWHALKAAGFKGCVFDKDNTLTEPYALGIHEPLTSSMKHCMDAFDGHVALLSNSAGLQEFDPKGEEAASMEKALGIRVVRHITKKPAGDAVDLEQHFSCKAEELVMIGDRYLTDIVYGNRNGLFTIRPAPLTLEGEPSAVLLARRIEDHYVRKWTQHGIKAPKHPMVTSEEMLKSFVTEPKLW